MAIEQSQTKTWLFRIVAAVWIATFVPLALLSLVLLEIPLWTTFHSDLSPAGFMLAVVAAAWFYIVPILLLVIGRRWNRQPAVPYN
jgi:hypothetical protein